MMPCKANGGTCSPIGDESVHFQSYHGLSSSFRFRECPRGRSEHLMFFDKDGSLAEEKRRGDGKVFSKEI